MGGVLRLAIDAALSQVDGAFGSRSDEWAVEPPMNETVVYHKDCLDGFGAAFAAWCHFGDDAEYIPIAYAERNAFVADIDKSTHDPGRDLYVVDFSFNVEQLHGLTKKYARIVILDHHESARKELMEKCVTDEEHSEGWKLKQAVDQASICVQFDMERAGCQLAWDYFFQRERTTGRDRHRPDFINYLGWRDLWWHKRRASHTQYAEEIEALHAYLDSVPRDFRTWKRVCENLEEAIEKGLPIVAYYRGQLRRAAANCIERFVSPTEGGVASNRRVALVNTPLFLASDMAEIVYSLDPVVGEHDYKMIAFWCVQSDGLARISLRSRERPGDINCAVFAEQYGGGGHPGAAGFQIPLELLRTIFPAGNRSPGSLRPDRDL